MWECGTCGGDIYRSQELDTLVGVDLLDEIEEDFEDLEVSDGGVILDDFRDKLEVGKVYKVTVEDCCVELEFTSRFKEWVEHRPDDGSPEDCVEYYVLFDNGVLITLGYGQSVHIEEVDDLEFTLNKE